ncbi:Cupredoxin [Zopfochytrium polystomum]|nr:Cupredoxin [Zopfochytrium polystomum]
MASQDQSAKGYVLFSASVSIPAWTQRQATFDIVVGTSSSNVTHAFNKLTDIVGQDCPSQVVSLDWELGYVNVNLKDLGARRMIGINGVWPPEAIYANIGDTLSINLRNNLNVPTALHFYGLHQTGAPQLDGFPMVNQCPIPANSNYTYTVFLNQTGTFFVEGSYAGQAVDGLRVPLIVRSTSDPKWDSHVVTLAEWYDDEYSTIFGTFSSTVNPLGILPKPEAILVNEQVNSTIHFNSGETYMLRILSFASQLSMFIAIDSHNMTIVEVDGFAVERYDVTALKIAPGQRFGVLVRGMHDQNTTLVNYKMHITQQIGNADSDGTEAPVGALGTFLTLSYGPNNPYGNAVDTTERSDSSIIYDDSKLRNLVSRTNTEVLVPTRRIILDAQVRMMADGSARGTFNNTAYIQPKVPSLITALTIGDSLKGNPIVYGADTNPIVIDDGVTEIVILNQDIINAHSFHLHGHSFQIMDIDNLPFDPSKNFDTVDNNPNDAKYRKDDDDDANSGNAGTALGHPMRDTVQIPPSSFAVLRFRNDNAGVWLLHSTNSFLRDFGLAATFIVNPNEIPSTGDLMSAAFNQTCAAAGVPTRGNAAGNLGTDLTGYIYSPGLPPTGTTAAFWGTVFGCAACVLVMVISVYLFHIPDDAWVDRFFEKKND